MSGVGLANVKHPKSVAVQLKYDPGKHRVKKIRDLEDWKARKELAKDKQALTKCDDDSCR